MNQVNGPQYTVWANRKFVGKNTEEVSEHILQDRDSINNDRHRELNESPTNIQDSEDHGVVRSFNVDEALFEETKPGFDQALDDIS